MRSNTSRVLDAVANGDFKTDKIGHGYFPHYAAIADELHERFPADDLRVLEVGTANGDGLALFRALFPDAWVIAGVDMNPATVNRYGPMVHANQADPKLADLISDETGCVYWDLIVDDASHLPHPSMVTCSRLLDLVRPGGFYVIEDWNHARNIMDDTPWRITAGAFSEEHGNPAIESITFRPGLIVIRKHPALISETQG